MENYKQINPIKYGLSKRIRIVEISKNHLGILKMRKSRIIMKDGIQLNEIADNIRKINPEIQISVIISGPICSKTTKYLESGSINTVIKPSSK